MDKRLPIIAGFIVLSWSLAGWPETIRFKDGMSIQVKVVERRDDAVVVEWNGRHYTYQLNEIAQIDDQPIETGIPKGFTIMDFILFLNANQGGPDGWAQINTDHDNRTLEYLDAEGRVMERSRINEHEDIVTQRFDASGNVVSEVTITDESVLARVEQDKIDHREKEVPALKAQLTTLAQAAERYAKDHHGVYPRRMGDLTGASPPYLTDCPCDKRDPTYTIICDVSEAGYRFKAASNWGHMESYIVSTGEQWEELGPRNPKHEKSTSPCDG